MKKGALDLESSEVKILVDKKGEPEKILQSENDESHHMIEEFMLLANETIAKEFRKKGCRVYSGFILILILKTWKN